MEVNSRLNNCCWLAAAILATLHVGAGSGQISAADDPRRPAAIAAVGPPVVPAELMTRLGQYQSVRSATFRGWEPNGKGILIQTRFGNSGQLHRVYEPGGRREQVTFFDEPATGDFLKGSSDGSLLVSMDTGGNENSQLYTLDATRYELKRLTDGQSRNQAGPVSNDGSQMVIASNQRNRRDMDLYRVDIRGTAEPKLIMQVENETWQPQDWTSDGRTLAVVHYVSINESSLALLDLASGQRQLIDPPGSRPRAFGEAAFSPDGRTVYFTCDVDAEFQRLGAWTRNTESLQWLTADIEWDVSDVEVDSHSGDLAFCVNADGATRLFLYRVATGERQELKIPLGVASGLEFSPDGKQLGFTLALPNGPADAFSIRIESGELIRWTYSEVGGLDPARFVAPIRIQFPSFDGRMIPAYYFRPAGNSLQGRLPVYIQIHGGPEGQYRPLFSGVIQYMLNELGVAVICPNVRGSSGYGKSYLKLDNAERREDSVKDIGALLDWIEKQPELDSQRVIVSGGSYGGYMVLASLVHFGERLKAGVDVVGIANFISFLEKTAPYRVDLRRAEYGDERDPKMRAVFEQISPLNHADKIESALLVIHGRNDPRVPFFEAEQIAEKVRARGKSVWTVYADNEGHGFAKRANSDYARAVEILFLKQHLGLP